MTLTGCTWAEYQDTPRWVIEGVTRIRTAKAQHNAPKPLTAPDMDGPVIT